MLENLEMDIETWLNEILEQEIPPTIAAFCFNLYEDEEDDWSMELIGLESFDKEDEDWACDEITDFDTRDNPFSWHQEAEWDDVFQEVISALKQYLEHGAYASTLKAVQGIGVGFVDGDLVILYSK